MEVFQKRGRMLATLIVAGGVLSSTAPLPAQNVADNGTQINVSSSDAQAAAEATLKHHAFPAATQAGNRPAGLSNLHNGAAAAAAGTINLNSPTLFPGDLSFQGGNTVHSAESHPIYLFSTSAKCTTTSCWGNPATFLTDLGESNFIHIVDQYIGSSASGRYTLGSATHKNIGPSSKTAPLLDSDMAALAHAAALASGQSGYGHIYHIFLPPGQDVCFTATDGMCYSPDNPSTFFFCAYHSSAQFKDIGHVLYTVEPFQNVGGCNVQPGTPNGKVVDSTMNSLSHELFETITDPDGSAWWNSTDNGLFGQEIADECSYISLATRSFFAPAFQIGGKVFAVQREYNNNRHACTQTP